ncbi:metallophosphoesterase [Pseudotamlana agarivorans]|uniref:metallophosphoesterase n=1 Tax=Pseudotamlana agarivorans TaxID=481183 RepID=UPI000ABF26F7|nr:metallophosphoesterase [Tamlana agarivorans]
MFSFRWLFYIFFSASISLYSQNAYKIHSHNDYTQQSPFWRAYTSGLESIEVDVFLKNDMLCVAHEESEISLQNTLESLYLEPLKKISTTPLAEAQEVQLLIDIKSEAYATLKAIEKALKKYPELIINKKLHFVISGNRPSVKDYNNYPDYILFDYQSLEPIPDKSLNKIALISLSFKTFSKWKGAYALNDNEYNQIKKIVDAARAQGKPFRFWGAPDTEIAWRTFNKMGVSFINTDHPLLCANYLNKVNNTIKDIKVAFVSDIHFQDIYGQLSDHSFKGVFNNETNIYTLLRTMDAQLHSTRIFNENYFALFAVLDDIVERGIKYVALPGDYTDDGQTIHLRGLQRILKAYETKHGLQFFITTGNHDPVGPFAQDSGKSDFMGENGQTQGIYSYKRTSEKSSKKVPDILSKDLKKMGYEGVFNHLKSFGFYPQENYLYWETPFSKYTPETYTYQNALDAALLDHRLYDMMPGCTIPDASYLVEPVPNLWLLAIDANVYLPKDSLTGMAIDPKNYKGASIGYNNVLTHKTHLLKWIKSVSEEAERLNKTLITFSHYPIIDFNDDASKNIESFFGDKKWQLERIPVEKVAQSFSDAGITIHVAGHMHINDTGVRTFEDGKSIVNIQTPSIAAYIPGYKILNIKSDKTVEVTTIAIDSVPKFNDLFSLYEKEYNYLKQNELPLWNHDILNSKSYHDFTMFHLKELVRLRFLEDDWEPNFKDVMLNLSGEDLLIIPFLNTSLDLKRLTQHKELYKTNWESAKVKAELALQDTAFKLDDFKGWSGLDIIFDFYRIRNADVLAISDIGEKQIAIYKWLFYVTDFYMKSNSDLNRTKLLEFYNIFSKFLNGAPADHFSIDYKTGRIQPLD